MAYRATGLRIMEDFDGALLIVSNGKKGIHMSHEISVDMLERAQKDEREAAMMFRQFSSFIMQFRSLRNDVLKQK